MFRRWAVYHSYRPGRTDSAGSPTRKGRAVFPDLVRRAGAICCITKLQHFGYGVIKALRMAHLVLATRETNAAKAGHPPIQLVNEYLTRLKSRKQILERAGIPSVPLPNA